MTCPLFMPLAVKPCVQILSVEDLVREARQIASSAPNDWFLEQTKTSRTNGILIMFLL